LAEPAVAPGCSGLEEALLSRIEDASLNASAPPQQRWLDGWIMRFSPGKAKRARCINAVAVGRLPLDRKLQLAADAYREAGLPMVLRLTRFSQPEGLDEELAGRGCTMLDDTRVMVCKTPPADPAAPLPPGTHWVPLDAPGLAEAVGNLRDSPPAQRLAHAQRLALSPVPCRGFAIVRHDDGQVLACGQFAREADLVGLYDVHTREGHRSQGLAGHLCKRLLALSVLEGARFAYLQVESHNSVARRLYERLGFVEAYAYHYRVPPQLPARC
jgi:GNAT superfamily N-acetyltransferase